MGDKVSVVVFVLAIDPLHRELFGQVFGLRNRRGTTTISVVKPRSTSAHIFVVDLWQSIDLSICRSQFGIRTNCTNPQIRWNSKIFLSAATSCSRPKQHLL